MKKKNLEIKLMEEEIRNKVSRLTECKNSINYETQVSDIEKLIKLRDMLDNRPKSKIDINTALVVAGNLAGILLIINHERLNVVTTKALSFILKSRI